MLMARVLRFLLALLTSSLHSRLSRQLAIAALRQQLAAYGLLRHADSMVFNIFLTMVPTKLAFY